MICRIGTRRSLLAKTQSSLVARFLGSQGIECQLVEITSLGDEQTLQPLYEIESEAPGIFCKRLQQALLQGEIDLAVHSMKDLPTTTPPGLRVWAVPAREQVTDTLIIHPSYQDASQPLGLARDTVVGTSSLRRQAQLAEFAPQAVSVPIRGNVPSRVEQVRDGKIGAALLATAGLNRLGLVPQGLVRSELNPHEFVCAPAQGALAVEGRQDCPSEWRDALALFHSAPVAFAVDVERRILRGLDGGCTLPLGVWCEALPEGWAVWAFLGIRQAPEAVVPGGWARFQRFDIQGQDADTLVRKTVAYFRGDAA